MLEPSELASTSPPTAPTVVPGAKYSILTIIQSGGAAEEAIRDASGYGGEAAGDAAPTAVPGAKYASPSTSDDLHTCKKSVILVKKYSKRFIYILTLNSVSENIINFTETSPLKNNYLF